MTSGGSGSFGPSRGDRAPVSQVAAHTNLGPALDLTPEQLDQVAVVTPLDIVQARALWLQHAPAPLVGLLDAEAQ